MAVMLYNDYSTYLRRTFGCKVQKIAVNAAFSCPNRDGTVVWGGCAYCNYYSFNPSFFKPDDPV